MAGEPAHASGDPRAAGAGRGRSRRLASDRPAGPARLCPGAGRGGTRQAGGRRHGPFGPSRTPVVPDGQWRAVPVWVIAPAGGAVRQRSCAGRAGVLPGRFVRSCRAGHGFVCRAAGAATASPLAAQAGNPTVGVRPAHPVRRQPGPWRPRPATPAGPHRQADHHEPRLGRSITGDVARRAGFGEKPPERAKEGKKEGIPHVEPA